MYFRRKTSAGRAYLQIVESRREGDQVRQQVIATLGRFEDLQASGQLERLLRSGARFAAKAMMLSAAADDAAIKIAVHRIGAALVFERLWEETGCRAVIADLAGKRGHKFTLERAVFLTVLHRLFVSGSDRAADRWREDYAIAGVEGLDLIRPNAARKRNERPAPPLASSTAAILKVAHFLGSQISGEMIHRWDGAFAIPSGWFARGLRDFSGPPEGAER